MSQSAAPFTASGLGINVTATSAALTAVALPASAGNTILFYNEGPNNAWIALGAASVLATLPTTGAGAATCTPIPAGAIMTLSRAPATDLFISTITRTGSAVIDVNIGEGS